MPRAPIFYEFGDPAHVLKIEDTPVRQPGPGELRINVKAFALNRADLLFIHGEHYSLPQFPSRLGDECSGVIDAIGEGIGDFKIGERVSTIPFHNDNYKTHSESTVAPARFVARFPSNLTFEEGTSIWMQYLTAYFAAVEICSVTPEDYVLIAAASSSAAIGCMQLTKALGATTIGFTRTSDKKQRLLDLGYDYVVAYREEESGKRVMDVSGGQGARMIYDPVGGTFAREYYDGLAKNATIIYYGMLSALSMEVEILPMVRTASIVHPYSMYNHVIIPEQLERGKKFIYDNLSSGKLKPVISRVFAFEEIIDSYRYMESNTQIGKIVVKIS